MRWQAVQRRKGYAIIPMAAASIMASKPAWSAVGRGAHHVIVRHEPEDAASQGESPKRPRGAVGAGEDSEEQTVRRNSRNSSQIVQVRLGTRSPSGPPNALENSAGPLPLPASGWPLLPVVK